MPLEILSMIISFVIIIGIVLVVVILIKTLINNQKENFKIKSEQNQLLHEISEELKKNKIK